MKKIFVCVMTLLSVMPVMAQKGFVPDDAHYGSNYWEPDTLGDVRAVVSVEASGNVIKAFIPWRRRDDAPEKKSVVVVDAAGNRVINDVFPLNINKEYGEVLFKAAHPGIYYIYYLPYHTSGGPYPKVTYPKYPDKSDPEWREQAEQTARNISKGKIKGIKEASFLKFESLGEFNSFYPMEITATDEEERSLIEKNNEKPFLLFPEDRRYPIRMFDNIAYRQYAEGASGRFYGEADLNEYYVFQLGLWAFKQNVSGVKVLFSDFVNEQGGKISADSMTCFNTSGTDWEGKQEAFNVNVSKGRMQPLWLGIQMPSQAKSGLYKGVVTVVDAEGVEQKVDVSILLSDNYLVDKGDKDLWRLSRLRWLNSQLQANDQLVKPYTPMTLKGNTVGVLGRTLSTDSFGLPKNICSYFTEEMTSVGKTPLEILSKPMHFSIVLNGREVPLDIISPAKFKRLDDGAVIWTSLAKAGSLSVTLNARMEFDGYVSYNIKVKAKENTSVDNISLITPMNASVAKYRLGMGFEGSKCPTEGSWKWDVKKNQEGFWFGTVNAGLQCLFRDTNYRRPLNTNFYQMQPLNLPPSWYNGGKGGINYKVSGGVLQVSTYSGERMIKAGDELNFNFLTFITPFRPIDTEKQWNDRYFHGYLPAEQVRQVKSGSDENAYHSADVVTEMGANVINLHHGNAVNPHINYPFFRPDFMKQYIDGAHEKGQRVKIYYTVRELTNWTPELFALKSLGHEIFSPGKGGGYAWLQEHFGDDYIAGWFVNSYKDAAVVNAGISRWHNFYVEGLNWLAKNVGIDGVYIDDLAFDRTTMKRIRRVLDANRPDALIDVHSCNQFDEADGYINSAFLYMEHFPYLDRLWFGENFKYEKGPDYWLTDVSGIPFGLMSEMLQGGGNPYRGMLYGMTAREPSNPMPARLWKVWDAFGIKGSRMMGYWVSYNPIKTDCGDVLATSYIKKGKVMIAVASWADADKKVRLKINWKQLGINPESAKLTAPAIEGFQQEQTFSPASEITVPKGKGFLLILQ